MSVPTVDASAERIAFEASGLAKVAQAFDEQQIVGDIFHRVTSARVVWFDQDATAQHLGVSDDSTDYGEKALLECLAELGVISVAQLSGDFANGPILVHDSPITGYRPPRYGRAAIIPSRILGRGREPAWFDVKGCGVAPGMVPQARMHRTGLLPLREAFRELLLQKMVEFIFEKLDLPIRGVPVYAILSLGFWGRSTGGGLEPAGAIVRKCHRRPPGNVEIDPISSDSHRLKLFIELMLRQFGITSANPLGRLRFEKTEHGTLPYLGKRRTGIWSPAAVRELIDAKELTASREFDVMNIQLTRDCDFASKRCTIVDFGHYYIGSGSFQHELIHLVADRRWNLGGIIGKDSPSWIQPIPRLAVDADWLGPRPSPPGRDVIDPLDTPLGDTTHGLTLLARELAREAVSGTLQPSSCAVKVKALVRQAMKGAEQLHPLGTNSRDIAT